VSSTGQVFTSAKAQYIIQEIDRIWKRVERPIAPGDINLSVVARAIGEYLDAGSIRGLRAFMDGQVIARQLISLNDAVDKYAIYASKPLIGANTLPVAQFDIEDPAVPALIVNNTGAGPTLEIKGLNSTEPMLKLTKGAGGGYIIDTNVAGCFLTNGGVWTDACTRSRKYFFPLVWDQPAFLERVRGLPIGVFAYKDEFGEPGPERHFGTTAEDFEAAFGLGNDKGLAAMDVAGVALYGVQSLLKRIEALEAEVLKLKGQQ
jgi:uncharacterized small protein (DUF1192 family)